MPDRPRHELNDEIRDILKAFRDASAADFRRDDLGPLGFGGAEPVFERLLRFITEVVTQVDADLLPDKKLQEFRDTLFSAHRRFAEVKGFIPDTSQEKPFAARDALVSELRELHYTLFNQLAPFIACASRPASVVESTKRDAERVMGALGIFEKEKRAEVDAILNDVRDLATKVKEAAQETGVSRHAGAFAELAKEHESIARRWLIAASALVAAGVLLATWSMVWTFNNRKLLATFDTIPATQFAIAKLLIASILFSALLWSVRMYRAHRHNVVVNRHRQTALSTFETFVKSTSDAETKNAVLLQATQSIFSAQTTGYMGEESESSGATKVVEIIRGLAEPKK